MFKGVKDVACLGPSPPYLKSKQGYKGGCELEYIVYWEDNSIYKGISGRDIKTTHNLLFTHFRHRTAVPLGILKWGDKKFNSDFRATIPYLYILYHTYEET